MRPARRVIEGRFAHDQIAVAEGFLGGPGDGCVEALRIFLDLFGVPGARERFELAAVVDELEHRSGLRAERDEPLPHEHVRDVRASRRFAERLRHGLQAPDPLLGVLESAAARAQPVQRAPLAIEHYRHEQRCDQEGDQRECSFAVEREAVVRRDEEVGETEEGGDGRDGTRYQSADGRRDQHCDHEERCRPRLAFEVGDVGECRDRRRGGQRESKAGEKRRAARRRRKIRCRGSQRSLVVLPSAASQLG